jgi:hypothetical protein
MTFALATLNIPVTVNTAGVFAGMDMVRNVTRDRMAVSGEAVQDFGHQVATVAEQNRRSMASIADSTARMQTSAVSDLTRSTDAARELQDSMTAASRELARAAASMESSNRQIARSASESAKAVQTIGDEAAAVSFDDVGSKMATAFKNGLGDAKVEVKSFTEEVGGWIKEKLIIVGVAAAVGITAAVATAVYAAYKSISFLGGLITGSSYKSENIDALVAANDKVKQLQGNLQLSAVQAGALDDALRRIGTSQGDYVGVMQAIPGALRTNTTELERLGVATKGVNGQILSNEQFLQNVKTKLDEYTEGWDRNQAATAIGVGSYKAVTDALKVSQAEIEASRDRLNDYNLGIGPETQAAVDAYQAAMREFDNESRLTSQGFKRAVADQIMPILTDLASFFKDGFPVAVRAFRYSMATVTSLLYGLKTVAYLVSESVIGSISAVGSIVGGLAVAAGRALTGDFAGARMALVEGWTDAQKRLGQIGDNIVAQARNNANAMRLAWGMDDRRESPAAKAAGKAWVAAPKPEEVKAVVDPYDALIKAIQEKAAVMAVDQDATVRATEADKAMAKYLRDLEEGYIDLNAAKEAVLMAALAELQIAERTKRDKEDQRKLLEAGALATDKYTEAVSKEIAKLTEEANTSELTEVAKQRLAATQQVENAALANLFRTRVDANGELVRELAVTPEVASQILLRMDADKKLVAVLVEKVAAQKLSLQYDEEIAKLRLDAQVYLDPAVKAAAALEIEAQNRWKVIESLKEDTEERRRLVAQYEEWLQASTNKLGADKFLAIWQSVDDVARNTFTSILQNGSDAFRRLRDTLKNTVYALLYEMTVRKWVFSVAAAATGTSGIANAATSGFGVGGGSGGGLDSGMPWMGTVFNGYGLGLKSTLQNGFFDGFSSNMLNIGGMVEGGSYMQALGSASPYIAAAIAAYKMIKSFEGGETRSGGQYRDSTLLAAPSGGQIDAGNITSAITATTASINGFFSKLGSNTRLGEFFSGLESSGSGKGFAYAGGTLSTGAVFGQGYDGQGYMNRRGNFDPAAAASAFGEELSQSILQALQADLDHLPEYVKKYLAGVDIDALGKDAADKLLATINTIATQKATLDKQIYELTTSDAQKLADARADERKAMDESLWPLLDRRIALEDERAATEKATAAAQEKARVDEQIANERQSIWRQIWQMEGNTAALREDQLKGMNEANQALQKYYWSLSDQAAAAEKARAAHERYQQSMNEAQTFLSGVWTNIGQYLDRMNASSAGMLSPKDQLTNAEAQFRRQAALAAGGDRTALSGITQYADQLAAATKAVSGSGGRTGEIYQLIQSTLSVLPSLVRPEQLIVDAITSLQSHTVSALAANTAATASTLGRAFDQISSGFTKLDVNFDGLLSRTEMEAALVKTGLATSADITALMAAYDTNGDGMISYLEKIEGNTRDFAVKVTQNFLGSATVSTGGQAGTRLYEYTAYANGQTYRTTADHAWTVNGYAANNPEVVSYFNQNYGLITALGQPSNIADYLEWHFRTYGIAEGRKFAMGSAFDGGGVVNTPTWFNADQMAEAGPEAIMPLARAANGKLGVQAVGTGRQSSSDPAVAAALQAVASSLSQGQQGTLAIKVVTTDGRELANQVIELARERSRRGELVIYSSGVKKV